MVLRSMLRDTSWRLHTPISTQTTWHTSMLPMLMPLLFHAVYHTGAAAARAVQISDEGTAARLGVHPVHRRHDLLLHHRKRDRSCAFHCRLATAVASALCSCHSMAGMVSRVVINASPEERVPSALRHGRCPHAAARRAGSSSMPPPVEYDKETAAQAIDLDSAVTQVASAGPGQHAQGA